LRFGAGASGFIMDSALLEQHHHAAEPTSQAYQSLLLVAIKRDATVQSLGNVFNRYAAGMKRTFLRTLIAQPNNRHVLCSCNAACA